MCNGSIGSPWNFPGFLIRLPPWQSAGAVFALVCDVLVFCSCLNIYCKNFVSLEERVGKERAWWLVGK